MTGEAEFLACSGALRCAQPGCSGLVLLPIGPGDFGGLPCSHCEATYQFQRGESDPLQWPTALPAAPGWYWIQFADHAPEIVCVTEVGRHFACHATQQRDGEPFHAENVTHWRWHPQRIEHP